MCLTNLILHKLTHLSHILCLLLINLTVLQNFWVANWYLISDRCLFPPVRWKLVLHGYYLLDCARDVLLGPKHFQNFRRNRIAIQNIHPTSSKILYATKTRLRVSVPLVLRPRWDKDSRPSLPLFPLQPPQLIATVASNLKCLFPHQYKNACSHLSM